MSIKNALISVYDKTDLLSLTQALAKKKVKIFSSGGTYAYLKEHGYEVETVESITQFPEMLSGRVKTLHPKIHGGILFKRDEATHSNAVKEHEIPPIDLVVVNLYPFEETVKKANVTHEEIIEQIDIGGPSLIRSASKNYKDVVILSSSSQYKEFCERLKNSSIDNSYKLNLSLSAFKKTAAYDKAISEYFEKQVGGQSDKSETLILKPHQELRYGENPHQEGSLLKITNTLSAEDILGGIKQLSGKELSYNNWLDIDAAWALVNEFEEEIPTCAIIKHNTPCGVAMGENIEEAYDFALECDPISSFGGIVALNNAVDGSLAKKLSEIFLEVIIAPSFTDEALEKLTSKKNLRLVTAPVFKQTLQTKYYRSILSNGMLVQGSDSKLMSEEDMKVVTEAQPSKEDWLQALFAFRVAKHVRSNAIVIVNENRTVGICGGQTNRVNSVRIALEQASDLSSNAVLASDGFFPFKDNVELCAQGRIKTIIQPGGSIRDGEVIEEANKHGIAMIFSGIRHFKH
jgi:phosphoribosylaminoimidazolecarboxamide formyltransferase/IMP cyclohydrolase